MKAIVELQFPKILKQLETYLGMTGALRQYIHRYAAKAEPLQLREKMLLKEAPVKGAPRKRQADRTTLQLIKDELQAFAKNGSQTSPQVNYILWFISVAHLEPCTADPANFPSDDAKPPPVRVGDHDEWEIKKLIRLHEDNILVKWKGYCDCTWQPVSTIKEDVPDLWQAFENVG
ncbi:hypothetical protein TRV_00741 [Trichophyton verrucosum HKI 0517]|uniref:Chromo domain-containing protein n=1 Tax=Trichophyton verrucosum (strain HKI 0517) TaxID=663202 RepID=D4D0Z5_TRIVH|nr:uncharacterized protein TRV_00741 [Trichophyton verrucosum HKI 0517]EFE44472.1 hypothetical protein TRV_00741 [Trichophyton verrucosum HKI 0517]